MSNKGSWTTHSVSPELVACQQNDVFSLELQSGGAGTMELLVQYLTIQVVE